MSQPTNKANVSATQKKSSPISFATIVMPLALVLGIIIWKFIMGDVSNFEGGDPIKGHPIGGNLLGTVYKGGPIVPVLMAFFMIVVIFSIERMLTLGKASGSGNVDDFIRKVKFNLESGNVAAAISECDKQKGSVANVVRAVLNKYRDMESETGMDREQKVLAIRQEVEESTSLELPMLEKNLPVLATLTSVGTLTALLGTVMGMIKAFSALATAGSPDAVALSSGISEALINTALGIATSVIAMIMYNYFTSRIDGMTYAIDEAGFSIANTFAAKHRA
jgi:biopolymer transport protein ExbB